MGEQTFIATKDNFMQSNAPNDNNGASTNNLNLCGFGTAIYRLLLAFNLSALPEGATITSATFSLYYYGKIGTPSGQKALVYKLRRNDWEEGNKIGAAGFSNWNYYKDGSAWGTAGAGNTTSDIDTSLNAEATYGDDYGWINWDIKDIVEDAIDNVSSIVNLLVKWQTEGGNYYAYHYPRENTVDSAKRPKLVIEYEVGGVSRRRSFSILHV